MKRSKGKLRLLGVGDSMPKIVLNQCHVMPEARLLYVLHGLEMMPTDD